MSKGLVLNFHKEENSRQFEKIIVALKRKYKLVTAQELELIIETKKPLENICHLTFDDGEKSFYDIVFPLLKKHTVPVSLFVSPEIIVSRNNFWFQEVELFDQEAFKSFVVHKLSLPPEKVLAISLLSILKCLNIDKIKKLVVAFQKKIGSEDRSPQNMTVDQLLEVDRSGLITIGGHTLNHPILKNESDANSKSEIQTSITSLQNILGHSVKYFAFPNGVEGLDFGEREIGYLKGSNISLNFSTEFDHLSAALNKLKIPRMSFPQMLGLSPGHPLVTLRLSLGKKWRSFRSNPPSEIEMRKWSLNLIKEYNVDLRLTDL